VSIGAKSDTGTVRTRNEDSLYAELADSPDARAHGWLGVVADGLGGRPAGHVASALAVDTLRHTFYGAEGEEPGDRLRSSVKRANCAIFDQASQLVEHAGMATTLTAALLTGQRLIVAHVGDSRAYLLREHRLTRLTRDHSLISELLQEGDLTPEQARTHPRRNTITRALGVQRDVEVDLIEIQPRDQDVLLLCTDGLYRAISDSEIGRQLTAPPEAAAESLVKLANEAGGHDNVSVIIAGFRLDAARAPATSPQNS
jgi:protein phosphatase